MPRRNAELARTYRLLERLFVYWEKAGQKALPLDPNASIRSRIRGYGEMKMFDAARMTRVLVAMLPGNCGIQNGPARLGLEPWHVKQMKVEFLKAPQTIGTRNHAKAIEQALMRITDAFLIKSIFRAP